MPSQIGYFDKLMSVAGKVFIFLSNITLSGVDGKVLSVNKTMVLDSPDDTSSLTFPAGVATIPKTTQIISGDGTAGRVLRSFALSFTPGATPNTNINIADSSTTFGAFNKPAITAATNLAASGSSGSFALSADGKTITMDITPAFIGLLGISYYGQKINSASASPYYIYPGIAGGNLTLLILLHGTITALDWRTVLDAGDTYIAAFSVVTDS